MKLRSRLTAGLVSAACCASMLSVMPALPSVHAETLVGNDFEVTYEGWCATENIPTLTAENGMGFEGSRGMVITDRKSPEDGAFSAKGLYLEGGVKYDYSLKVYSETDETFRLALRLVDMTTGEETVKELVSQNVKAGEWTTLKASYKAPKNSASFTLTLTTDSTNDFRFDDVKIVNPKAKDSVSAATAEKGLKDEFVDYFRVGNILNGGTVSDSRIQAIMIRDHNAIECENETKPDATLVQNGSTDTDIKVSLNRCASIIDFCVKNGIAFRGHTMVWHSQTPTWFFRQGFQQGGSYVSSSVMDQRMESYIKNMFNAYKTQYPTLNLYAYDVCNEVIDDGRAAQGGVRTSDWTNIYKNNSFVEKAFTYARRYAPDYCKLFYNDYNEFAYDKQNCIINTILKPLKAKGVLDGMGMQSHVSAAASNAWGDTNSYLSAMDKYLNLGIEVQVTELDIACEAGRYSSTQQANKYKAIFEHAMNWNKTHTYDQGRVTLVQVWGPKDGNSWVDQYKENGQVKGNNDPLLYNRSYQPKEAYTAVTSLIPQSQWGDGTKYKDGFEITPPEPDKDGYWYHYTFEDGVGGMNGRGSASVAQSSAAGYNSAHSLAVTGRESSWNGATTSLNSMIFKPGEKYSFSADVMFDKGSATEDFYLTLEYTGSDGEGHWPHIAAATAIKGEWVQLANVSFEIPSDATNISVYVETADTLTDFYVDEMIGAPEGTVINGPKEISAKPMPGDVNCDGKLNAADLSLMKACIRKGAYPNAIAKLNADVNQNAEIDATDVKLLHQFLMTEIDEFPVETPKVDWTEAEKQFANIRLATSYKQDNENNPMTTQRFGADPGWLVYKDRLYVYTTNDAFEYNGNTLQINSYNSGTINCVSSADLVNWTDHGAIPVAGRNSRTTNGAAKWASFAWAPDACWKTIDGKDKFFLYFADSAGGIGVLTADSPTGPFKDPLGHALITRSTENCSGVDWMFDPGVYYDPQTNEGYIAFGGGTTNRDASNPKTGRIAKLGDNMISLVPGTVKEMQTPYLFEDSSLIKIGDTWYYSYCTNFSVGGTKTINGVSFNSGQILCMTSKDPLTTWTGSNLKSLVLGGMCDNGGNNHHSIIYFKDKYYILYHSRQKAIRQFKAEGLVATNSRGEKSNDGNYRSTHINEASFDPSTGKITCTATMGGCKQLEYLDPYQVVPAETMANNGGIQVSGVGNTVVTDVDKGDWVKVKGVNFKNGAKTLTVRASSRNGAYIKVCAGGADGTPIAYVQVPAGGNMTEIPTTVLGANGVTDLTFVFSGQVEFDSWQFK